MEQRKLTVEEVKDCIWALLAQDIIADRTQVKRLEINLSSGGYRVRRAYFHEKSETIKKGTLEECVEAYNSLS